MPQPPLPKLDRKPVEQRQKDQQVQEQPAAVAWQPVDRQVADQQKRDQPSKELLDDPRKDLLGPGGKTDQVLHDPAQGSQSFKPK